MEDIIVFGHGRYYISKENTIKQVYNVVAFLDNAVKIDEESYDNGVPILNPEHIKTIPSIPILIMSVNFFQMAVQLFEFGVNESRIRFGTSIIPYYDNVECLFDKTKDCVKAENKKIILYCPLKRYEFEYETEYKQVLRAIMAESDTNIKLFDDMPVKPMSRRFGLEYGKAVDRFYIEMFLNENKRFIKGDIMEIAEATYTNMFGNNVKSTFVLHVNGWGKNSIKGNLETGEGIIENSIDCLICTQTLEHIFNTKATVKNIYRLLKKGGTALITVAGIKQISLYDYYNWGEFWRFTKQSMYRLLVETFEESKMEVFSYGNIKTTVAMLYGVCQEQLNKQDFEYNDEQYPLIVAARVQK